LKCRAKSTRERGELVINKVREVEGVLQTISLIVFHTEKE